jgi:hypothetical protein
VRDGDVADGTEREVADVDLSMPFVIYGEDTAVDEVLSSSWIIGVISCESSSRGPPTGLSNVPASQRGTV